jgi:hypothetical protein
MDKAKTEELKQAINRRARELGMDPNQRHTCSPGIKALAQMYQVVVRYPDLLQIFADDLLVHDFGLLTSPDAPDRFVWTIRPSGTNLFYPEPAAGTEFLFHMRTQTGSVAYTFDSEKLERVHNLDYAARFLTDHQDSLAA